MDEQRISKLSSKSNENRLSNRSSFLSIERLSNRNPSLSKRLSLINAMDIQLGNSTINNLDDELIEKVTNRFSQYRRSSGRQRQAYNFLPNIEQKDLNRKSNYVIKHECICTEQQCHENHCTCYLTPNQICVIGQCCPKCIMIKNQFFKNTRGYKLQKEKEKKDVQVQQNSILKQIKKKNYKNMHYMKQIYANQPIISGLIFCTCKKSHCQKNYCLCYQNNVKCGEYCSCLQCQNKDRSYDDYQDQQQRRWQRYATYVPYDQNQDNSKIDQDIQQFLEQRMLAQGQQFQEVMQFQPVNFDAFISNVNK